MHVELPKGQHAAVLDMPTLLSEQLSLNSSAQGLIIDGPRCMQHLPTSTVNRRVHSTTQEKLRGSTKGAKVQRMKITSKLVKRASLSQRHSAGSSYSQQKEVDRPAQSATLQIGKSRQCYRVA